MSNFKFVSRGRGENGNGLEVQPMHAVLSHKAVTPIFAILGFLKVISYCGIDFSNEKKTVYPTLNR